LNASTSNFNFNTPPPSLGGEEDLAGAVQEIKPLFSSSIQKKVSKGGLRAALLAVHSLLHR